ncbi:hypothetical protein K0B96_10485 [Horticoccus luteus]|uniref:Teneurin-like YD-shell domain-containing protein n=1 Tax=Horticoccus luteus TaxID=2862869 RepID=A0A8F9XF65_9BACT|nr:RHS repeat-associated core domain-containing protein [Horticoccus luteus]QYM77752.1 hypothetical protein K0B96_10485 [Horticoccus luteus]
MANNSPRGAALNKSKPGERLKEATNGFGVAAEITCTPLTERDAATGAFTVFEKGPVDDSTAPDTIAVIAPMHVVKTVENVSEFSFGAAHERVKQVSHLGTTLYIGSLFEKVTGTGGSPLVENRHYIMAPTGRVAVYVERNDSTHEVQYFHTDGLGSITAVTNELGQVVKRFAFDAWGKRFDVDLSTYATALVTSANNYKVTRGFTDHEHLDDLGLIHMNGRVYDPVLGRFLSADPFVGDAGDSQDYNRYSYLSNNPLGGTDPSGYFSLKDVGVIVAVVVAAVVTAGAALVAVGAMCGQYFSLAVALQAMAGVAGAPALTAFGAVVAGAGAGFGSAFAGSLLNGGSVGDAFKAGAIGAVVGGIAGGLTYGIGSAFPDKDQLFERMLAHGVAEGGVSEAQGGQFRHGFYAGFFTAGASPFVGNGYAGAVESAVVGGTASALGGGKFANGAVSGAFQYLLNAAQHESQLPSNEQDAKVSVGFYDKSDKGDFLNSAASHEDFEAGANARSTLSVGVSNEKEIAEWFKNNPGKVDSIGFFGHGNSDGIYINGKAVSASTIRLFANHLNPSGKAYFFACEVGAAGGGTPNAWARRYFYQGQTIYAAKDLIKYTTEHRPGGPVHTGRMGTDGDYLWMWSYTGGKKP